MTRTGWFPVTARPARPGKYEVVLAGAKNEDEFSSALWVNGAWVEPNTFQPILVTLWRGLTRRT